MSTTATAEVEQLLKEWSDAYQARDIDTLLATAIGDDLQLVGTGADEVRFGLDEFRTQALRDFSQADEAAFEFTDMRVTTVGDAAFVYCDVSVSGSAVGQTFAMSGLRMTAGLVRTDDGWRLVQTHLSAPDSAQAEGNSFEG